MMEAECRIRERDEDVVLLQTDVADVWQMAVLFPLLLPIASPVVRYAHRVVTAVKERVTDVGVLC